MKLNRTIAVLAGLCVSFLLAGCANSKEYGLSPKEPEEITVWHYYNGAQAIAFEQLAEEFNSTVGIEKGIIVEVQSKSSIDELVSAVLDSAEKKAGAEKMPEIFQSYLDTAVQLDGYDILSDLNQYVTEEEKQEYLDEYVEEGNFGTEGEWKLFPIAKGTEVLVLNKTDWERFATATGTTKAELTTWEGITDVSEKYYEYSGGRSFFGRDAFSNYMIIGSMQLGTELFLIEDEKVKLQIEEETMKKLWDNFYVPYVKGYFSQVGRYRTDDIKIGEIIALVGSTSGTAYFPNEVSEPGKEPYPIEYQVLPVPNFEGKEPYAVQQGASMAVSNSTPRKEYASVLFLKWFTETERNIKFSVQAGYMPVKKEASDVKKIEQYLENEGTELSGIEKDTLIQGVKQATESNLYITKGFPGGYEARNVLETSMKELAIANRKLVLAQTESGVPIQEAIDSVTDETHFQEWLLGITKQLEEFCQ